MQPTVITENQVKNALPPRAPDSHKGTFGRLLIVGGSYGLAGAPLLAAKAALRCGVGLAEAAVPDSIYPILATALPEAVYTPLPADNPWKTLCARLAAADALVVGCGMGRGANTRDMATAVLRDTARPVVLDADGINMTPLHILSTERTAPTVITPHPAEMARLWGVTASEVQAARVEFAAKTALKTGTVTVLKGHRTLIATPAGDLWENPTGNDGLATGGSGDVLAGIIGSLLAQGLSPADAAVYGVYIHGAAADMAAAKRSRTALLPSDVIDTLCDLFLAWGR